MSKRHINIYRDDHSGGWVLEIMTDSGWYIKGVYGTRAAAMADIR